MHFVFYFISQVLDFNWLRQSYLSKVNFTFIAFDLFAFFVLFPKKEVPKIYWLHSISSEMSSLTHNQTWCWMAILTFQQINILLCLEGNLKVYDNSVNHKSPFLLHSCMSLKKTYKLFERREHFFVWLLISLIVKQLLMSFFNTYIYVKVSCNLSYVAVEQKQNKWRSRVNQKYTQYQWFLINEFIVFVTFFYQTCFNPITF